MALTIELLRTFDAMKFRNEITKNQIYFADCNFILTINSWNKDDYLTFLHTALHLGQVTPVFNHVLIHS